MLDGSPCIKKVDPFKKKEVKNLDRKNINDLSFNSADGEGGNPTFFID